MAYRLLGANIINFEIIEQAQSYCDEASIILYSKECQQTGKNQLISKINIDNKVIEVDSIIARSTFEECSGIIGVVLKERFVLLLLKQGKTSKIGIEEKRINIAGAGYDIIAYIDKKTVIPSAFVMLGDLMVLRGNQNDISYRLNTTVLINMNDGVRLWSGHLADSENSFLAMVGDYIVAREGLSIKIWNKQGQLMCEQLDTRHIRVRHAHRFDYLPYVISRVHKVVIRTDNDKIKLTKRGLRIKRTISFYTRNIIKAIMR
jgi:hypothetical protein